MASAWSGIARMLKDMGLESFQEITKWGRQKSSAEAAREKEAGTKNLWSMIGTVLALPLGPIAPLVGSVVGNIAKAGAVDESETLFDTSDVGKWNRSKDIAYLEDINRELEAYDTAEFWQGVKDVGTAALTSFTFGGGMGGKYGTPTPGKFSPFRWGGAGGQTTGELFGSKLGSLFQKKLDPGAYADYIDSLYS